MPTRSANIFKATRDLLALLAPHSRNSSKHKSGMDAQSHALLSALNELGRRHDGSKECTAAIKDVREALYGAVAMSQQQPVRIGKPTSLSDRAEHNDAAAAAEQHADASFDPRADEHWSRW